MKINPYIFRGYDIRGVVNKEITTESVTHIGKAFGTLLKRRGVYRAVVGRDCRKTGEEYANIIIEALNSVGVSTIDIGMELVGTFYWAQYHLECKGGVYVTASHNPVDYNGFKLANDYSETLVSEDIQLLREMIEEEDYDEVDVSGSSVQASIREEYMRDILSRFSPLKDIKVVIDPSCATPAVIAPEMLRRAGAVVVEKNCVVDGSFPVGTPDPTDSKNANRLSEEVLSSGADIGFSYDADGDRMGVVDGAGRIIWNDVLVALFAKAVLSKNKGATIMYNTLCSKVVEETIKSNGGNPFMWRTGHSFLKKKNQEVGADFIGELSGHFFFSADFYNHDDGLYSTLALLDYLSQSNQTLAQAVDGLPHYFSSPEIKVYCADDKKVSLIKKIALLLRESFADGEVVDDERAGDGVRVDFNDSMFVIRYSQNAPYLTIKFEGKTEERYEYLRKYIRGLLEKYQEIDWTSNINVNTEAL